MNTSHLVPALASLLAFALPVQAQNTPQAFNPFAMLAPIMTPLGLMMVPTNAPNGAAMNGFNPAMFNPAMLPAMPAAPAPVGMVPFSGLQALPQAYGMPSQIANPFASMPQQMANPFAAMPQFAMPTVPNQAAFPMFQGFPSFPGFPFPAAR